MKRFCSVAALMLLSSPVCAADSISFVIGGHRIHIETLRRCSSPSCISVSIPGIDQHRSRHDRDDHDRVEAVAKDAPSRPAPASSAPAASKSAVQAAVCAPPAPVTPVAPAAPKLIVPQPPIQTAQLQPPPAASSQVQPSQVQPSQVQPRPVQAPKIVSAPPPAEQVSAPPVAQQPAVERPAEVAPPTPLVASPTVKFSQEDDGDDEPADTPVGDWQTEGKKGAVRIEPCGRSLCGYVLDAAMKTKGETVLVDMKRKSSSGWWGSVYSHDSGNTYYGTIAMKGTNVLRVEACAIGRFFCSGTDWSRIDKKSKKLISSSKIPPDPRS